MRSFTRRSFWDAYDQLPERIRGQAREAYRLFEGGKKPGHRSLQFKRVSRTRPVYSARITDDYRALGLMEQGDIYWFWVGSHHEYDNTVRSLSVRVDRAVAKSDERAAAKVAAFGDLQRSYLGGGFACDPRADT